MGEAREENEKLKLLLTHLMKDYHSLQTNFFDVLQQDSKKQEDQVTSKPPAETPDHRHEQNEEESELVSLSLGLKTTDNSRNEDSEKKKNNSNSSDRNKLGENLKEGGLALRLGITLVDSSVSSESVNVIARTESNTFEKEAGKKVEEPTAEVWPASEVLKTMRSNGDNNGEAASQQSPMKKARVSIRARCDTQMVST